MMSPKKFLVRRIVFTLMAVVGGIVALRPAGAAGVPDALQQLVERANRERRVVHASSDNPPEEVIELNRRFNKKFGVNITIEGVPLTAAAAVTRLLQEKAANRITIDVLHPSQVLALKLVGKGVLSEVDWVGVFGKALPGIKEASTRAPQGLRNQALDFKALTYIPMYNTKLVAKADVPKKWTDLLDPKWKGKKIIVDPRGNSFYLLFLEYGETWTLDFASKLVTQDPLFISGTPAIAKAVARGEAPLGIGALREVLTYRREGTPVEASPVDVVPVVPSVILPAEGSPHPNAARLFTAWMATEGLAAEEEMNSSGRAWPGSGWALAKELDKTGARIVFASSPKEVEAAEQMLSKVQKIMQRK